MKIKARITQVQRYLKELVFDIDIEVTDDPEFNAQQAKQKILEKIGDESIWLDELKDTFDTSDNDVEIIEWNTEEETDF